MKNIAKSNYQISQDGKLKFTSKSGDCMQLDMQAKVFYVDLFCGAGGVSWGVTKGGGTVIYCINHDPLAIASHAANLPNTIHATEDIKTFDLTELCELVKIIRQWNQEAIICLWASLECTHFSKAKGGNHRDADSRTLAEHLYRYIEALNPDYIDIENVVEFMSWGPLRIACEKSHKNRSDLKVKNTGGYHMVPYSKKNGKYYQNWKKNICEQYGYEYDNRILNSADFGAITARRRYFGQFIKPHVPFTWPKPTHAQNPEKEGLFGGLKKWKAVKPALDLEDEGKSIFNRKKDLSENTLKRIYAGLVKYVGEGKEPEFIMKYLSNNPKSGISNPVDLDGVCPTVTTQNRLALVNTKFIAKHFSGKPHQKVHPLNEPARTITTSANQSIVTPTFLMKYHGTGENLVNVDGPSSTLTTKDRIAKIQVIWIDKQFRSELNHQSVEVPAGSILTNDKHCKMTAFFMNNFTNGGQNGSLDNPAPSIMTVPKSNVIQAKWLMNHNYQNTGANIEKPAPTLLASRKHFYILNPQYQSKGNDLNRPCFTLIARMDKMPPYLVDATEGEGVICIYDEDCETMQKIKLFMAMYGIMDIKMRMLKVAELLRIQGFGDQYQLIGTQTDQKRFIGNSVEVNLAMKKAEARLMAINKLLTKQAVA
ncbi:DNA cytosine methyltransferase [Cyclobacterium marinum]|uniref:DNA (cytosine-5-)-methyltransferase n=1 Tax=Cyclobacterium marinum (strain ATCC 25205 / DSM 745 / LMG 13164 / NCIMB 1802) TaxID=880070 RepID=G0J3A7_CYCMS|nr:DNA cytosine methyltransferase [Cyclobacterium marinum]AEL24048.1 C-5 cytosine-specific DNA methylase [Cyclobacterium marinum DSM 745]